MRGAAVTVHCRLMLTTSSTIDAMIDALLGREGGYSNNPADKGGPTMWGITEQVARAYGYRGDMRALPRSTAADIYRRQYWSDPRFDEVGQRYPHVGELLFDTGVNMGVGVAGAFLQRVLNAFNLNGAHYADLVADGRVGAISLHALDSFRQRRGEEGGERLLGAIGALRGARYIDLTEARPANEAFAYGWIGRLVDLLKSLR